MKRLLIIALSVCTLFTLAACAQKAPAPASSAAPEVPASSSEVQLPNPFADHETLDAAAAQVGFSLTLPETLPLENPTISYRTMQDSMLEVTFAAGEDKLQLRKAAGSEDISGDFNQYTVTEAFSSEQPTAVSGTLRGDDKGMSGATWVEGDYTYSLTSSAPMTKDEMLTLIANIH